MFKKVTAVTALSAALLFGGALQSTAHASATDQGQNQSNTVKIYHSTNGHWFQNFQSKCFPQNNWSHVNKEKGQDTQKKPKQKTENDKSAQNNNATQSKPGKNTEQQNNKTNTQNNQLSQYEQQVVDLTNEERAKHGLSPLKVDLELSKVAHEKSRDMSANGYFSHNSPTYGSPFDMMKSWGISYSSAGENIAKGQRTPQEVVNAWMNSEGHRANILNKSFTHIGVGYVAQGNVWTQQFIGK